MATTSVRRMDRLAASIAPFLAFFTGPFAKLNKNPDVANFAVGNPQDFPLPEYVDALRGQLDPRRRDWFAYKDNEPKSRIAVARGLAARTGMQWDPADVAMTNGGFAALAVAMRALVGAGRRGDLPLAAVVLLRVHDPGRRRRADPPAPRPARLRAGHGRDRGGHHAAHPGHHLQLAAQPVAGASTRSRRSRRWQRP